MNNALVKAAKNNGWNLLEDNDQYKNRIEISGSSGNKYIVAQRKANGQWSCGCLGFRRHRHCKHLDAMLPALLAATNKQIEEAS
jgi:hypothetical protein